jgi:hypothetical protein
MRADPTIVARMSMRYRRDPVSTPHGRLYLLLVFLRNTCLIVEKDIKLTHNYLYASLIYDFVFPELFRGAKPTVDRGIGRRVAGFGRIVWDKAEFIVL